MNDDYIGDQLYIAVKILIGWEGDIRSRLEGVSERCFRHIGYTSYPFPERLRERLEDVQAKLKSEGLRVLDTSDCSSLALEIFNLWEAY